ncbi:MAG: FtsW/RodA/SpoVE family cell cycle protein, partial [Deltaproteobacteria bacterium]|nr:FtsW/RodA/SpoVE family cell cycle protein [Deltaproteobacteria bacterium]
MAIPLSRRIFGTFDRTPREAGAAPSDALSGRYDVTLFVAALALVVVGSLLVFSTTGRLAQGVSVADPLYHVKHLALLFSAGALFFVVALKVPMHWIRAAGPILMPVSIALLIGVAVFGSSRFGARRWYDLGFINVQPSEVAKVAFALYLARYMAARRTILNDFLSGILPVGLMYVLPAMLLAIQPDVGSVVLMGALLVAMLVVGGTRVKLLGQSALVLVVGIVILILSQPEKMARFVGWFFPEATRMGEGYQVYQAQILVGSGGLLGSGLGGGVNHMLGYLPQSANDFIFAVAGEELGFVGVCAVVLLYVVIGLRGFAIARMCRDDFMRFAAFSLTLLLVMPAFVHMAVDLGL